MDGNIICLICLWVRFYIFHHFYKEASCLLPWKISVVYSFGPIPLRREITIKMVVTSECVSISRNLQTRTLCRVIYGYLRSPKFCCENKCHLFTQIRVSLRNVSSVYIIQFIGAPQWLTGLADLEFECIFVRLCHVSPAQLGKTARLKGSL